MLDKSKFMEMLAAITEVAKVQENHITKEEIQNYFEEMGYKYQVLCIKSI